MPQRAIVSGTLLLGIAILLSTSPAYPQSGGKVVDVIQVKGLIDFPTASYLEDRIASAQAGSTDEAMVIELDSAGGLVDSIPRLVDRMRNSRVPVVVWVAPRGADAASAGAVLVSAADLAFMAGDTRLGSASPVNLSSREPTPLEVSRTATLMRRLTLTQGRSVPAELLKQGAFVSSAQAAGAGAIDGVASSLAEVLRKMDGRTVEAGGTRVTLATWDAARQRPSVGFRFEEMDPVARALHAVTSPEVAFLLLLVGAFALIFEIYNPGIGLAAIIGVIALAGSFYALNVLPTDWIGVMVIVAAIVCFVVDLQLSGFGIWSAAGVVGVIAGGALLFSSAPTGAQLSPWAIAVAVVISLLFFVSVMTAALRVRLRRPITGEEGIVGTVGEATTDIAPEGTVATKGKLWRARTMETGIASGSKVRIKASEGLVLLVEPLSESELADPQVPGGS